MTTSKIEWTDRSDWNPIRGCTRVSPGCGGPGKLGGCYAEAMAARFSKPGQWGHGFAEMRAGQPRWTGKVELQEDRITLPLSWRKPCRVFVSSTSDVFHEALPDSAIDKLFDTMARAPWHTYQILTKRADRMLEYMRGVDVEKFVAFWSERFIYREGIPGFAPREPQWPLPNVWLGVSAEDQARADERIPLLLQTPAAVRFVSLEPLLGPIDLYNGYPDPRLGGHQATKTFIGDWWEPGDDLKGPSRHGLDWVIVGGESGPHARPMEFAWVLSLRDQCEAADVPFFFKQWGEWIADDGYPGEKHRVGKKAAGRLLDGVEHNAMPVRS